MAILGKKREITAKAVRGVFQKSFLTIRRSLWYPMIVDVHDSHVESDFAAMLGTVPQVEEVVDDVQDPRFAKFQDYRVDWKNRLYRANVSISRSLLDFDQTGQSRTLLHSMAARLANWPEKLVVNRLVNGTNASIVPAWEAAATPYFSASHAIGGNAATMSNTITGSTSLAFIQTTSPLSVAHQVLSDFREALARMASFTDDQGEPFHNDDLPPEALVIVCSPEMAHIMRTAFQADTINATSNQFVNGVGRIIASNYLGTIHTADADRSSWYLLHVRERVRPFKYSRFRKITDEEIEDYIGRSTEDVPEHGISMDAMRDLSSVELLTNLGKTGSNAEADVMLNDRYLIQARWRGEVFGGEWRNAIKVTNT